MSSLTRAAGSPFDFNTAPKQGDHSTTFDLHALGDALAAAAMSWVPSLFPNGKRVDDEWVLGGIDGRAARKAGSCKINLRGRFAGSWKDWDDGDGGGPIDTVRQATGLDGRELYQRCAEITGSRGSEPLRHSRTYRPSGPIDRTHEIAFVMANAVPAAGSLVERAYFPARGLPWIDCADLMFSPDVANFEVQRGFPAMLAKLRNAKGEIVSAIHRTYLRDDGTGKADVEKAKKMLGDVRGSTLHLVEMGPDGRLGTCEGIETGAAAHHIFGLPVWPALSTSGIIGFEFPAGCKHLTLFADAGHAGQGVITKIADKCRLAGVAFDAVTAIHGDDFADDLVKGATRSDYIGQAAWLTATPEKSPSDAIADDSGTVAWEKVEAPALVAQGGTVPRDFENLERLARQLTRTSPTPMIGELLGYLCGASLTHIPRRRVLDAIRQQTGMSIVVLEKACKALDKEQRAAVAVVEPTDGDGTTWTGRLLVTEHGTPIPCVHNAMVALRHAPDWAGVLWFNEMSLRVMVRRPLPWAGGVGEEMRWADHLDVLTASWLQTHGIMVSPLIANQAVLTVAQECRYHPVRDYLDALVWDETPRLDTWLIDRCGTDDTLYTRSIAAAWMIQAVARAMRPGCKADCALILEGPQGLKKSTVAKVLGGDWFTDNIGKMGDRDSIMRAMAYWIVEIAELDGMNRAEVDTVKAFLSCSDDNFRPPYGRETVENKRQFVFIGTVNPNGNGYIKDDTGGRRFWPVQCRPVTEDGRINIPGLAADRDQLWAEAVARFVAGEKWWLAGDVEAIATEQQALRQEEDEWLVTIAKHVEWKNEATISEILAGCLNFTPDKMGRSEQMRVARCLKKLRFEKVKRRLGRDQTQWVYVRPA